MSKLDYKKKFLGVLAGWLFMEWYVRWDKSRWNENADWMLSLIVKSGLIDREDVEEVKRVLHRMVEMYVNNPSCWAFRSVYELARRVLDEL